jgi:S-(hydroxymethyl)glutathione dehydrogenase / alcohol dehydrogenase
MGRKIWAAVVEKPGAPPLVQEVDLVDPGPGEVVIDIKVTGICHTDVGWAAGDIWDDFPVVLGHESAGIVAAVGDGVTKVTKGDRVALSLAHHCGRCFYCESGHPMLCRERRLAPPRYFREGMPLIQGYGTGTFATATVVGESSAVKIPDYVPLEIAAITGCAVSTGMGAVMNIAGVTPGSNVAVFGCGGIGLCAIMASRVCGAVQIVAIDPAPARRNAAVKFGATEVVAPIEVELRRLAPEGFDYVFECAGRTNAMEMAIRLTRRGGDVVLIGAATPDALIKISALEFVVSQRHIHGCATGDIKPNVDFDHYFQLYRRGLLNLDALISSTIDLERIEDGFRWHAAGEGIRTLVSMSNSRA